MINLIFDKEIYKILTIISISPGSRFNRNEIKEKTKLNNVPLDNALSKLINTGLLKKEKRMYSINYNNSLIKLIIGIVSQQYKELKEIPLNVYFLIIDLVSDVKLIKSEVYLFGSYSKLIYNENSDIDIAILDKFADKLLIKKLEEKYAKKIEVHTFDKSEFYKNKKDPLIKEILKNGIKLL